MIRFIRLIVPNKKRLFAAVTAIVLWIQKKSTIDRSLTFLPLSSAYRNRYVRVTLLFKVFSPVGNAGCTESLADSSNIIVFPTL